MKSPKTDLSVVLALVAIVASLSGLLYARQAATEASAKSGTGSTTELSPKDSGRVRSGKELLAVFIASSTCGASQLVGLPQAIHHIRRSLPVLAGRDGRRAVLVGVALDHTAKEGLKFLSRFGEFDEIMVGGSWLNSGAVQFLIRDQPGPLAMPQLVLVERDITTGNQSLQVGTDRVVARHVGGRPILAYAGSLDTLVVTKPSRTANRGP
jgi:hypothetical protein